MDLVDDLRSDRRRIGLMKNIRPDPAPFGSEQWWEALGTDRLPLHQVEGRITDVYWESMGDYPMFEVSAGDGSKTAWYRAGDVARYVVGLHARAEFVMVGLSIPNVFPGLENFRLPDPYPEIVSVRLEGSERRSNPRASGPGGVGRRGR